MTKTDAKVIAPYHGSNFIPFEGRNTASGYAIEPKQFPKRRAIAMTICIGMLSAGFLVLIFHFEQSRALRTLAVLPLIVGTFGPAVGLWIQSEYQISRGALLRYNADSEIIELPRTALNLARSDVTKLVIVKSGGSEFVYQLQIHTIDKQTHPLITTLDARTLRNLATALGTKIKVPVDEVKEVATK